jgi:hypothetical protein
VRGRGRARAGGGGEERVEGGGDGCVVGGEGEVLHVTVSDAIAGGRLRGRHHGESGERDARREGDGSKDGAGGLLRCGHRAVGISPLAHVSRGSFTPSRRRTLQGCVQATMMRNFCSCCNKPNCPLHYLGTYPYYITN